MAINKVMVIGNLGADPVIRTLPNSGRTVANFSLATTKRFTDLSGEKQQRTQWLRVVAFSAAMIMSFSSDVSSDWCLSSRQVMK
jgi:single stranded DNA-binding protein